MNNELKGYNGNEALQLGILWDEEDRLWEEEMNRVKFDRISRKIKKIMTSPMLSNLSWKDELEDITKRIIPGKTINPGQSSIRSGMGATPTGENLLELISHLENSKINIVRKGIKGTFKSVINNLDIIDFLDRDFLFLGKVKEGSDVPVRNDRDCDWYGSSSPYSSQADADCIYDMVTVINNKIFYLESLIWEMDYNDKFSKHIYFDIIVYDVSV